MMYCCEPLKLTIDSGGIRKFHNKWISDIVMYREDESTFSPVYNIEGINLLVYHNCPFCGKLLEAPKPLTKYYYFSLFKH